VKLKKLFTSIAVLGGSFIIPSVSFAGAAISEIMYDLPGADTGREWVEVQNTSSEEVSFLKWKLFEANTNHSLTLFQGNATTSTNGFAIIADDPTKFLADNPQYSGTLFDSSFSLSNTGETLELKADDLSMHQTTYASSSGGAGDGNSLHKSNNIFVVGIPSPGSATIQTPISPASSASSSPETEETSPPPATSSETSGSANYGATTGVYKPQIYVSAFVSQRGVAGAPILFDAAAVGVKKEPITNARYVWSFGDGGTAEGKKVYHTYHYPAAYTVLVDASSGELSAMDRKEITIDSPEIVIENIKAGEDGFIEVKNNGKNDVDLSLWILRSMSGTFTIPNGTLLGARKAIPFPAQITGLSADPKSTALLYPNGNLVVAYKEKSAITAPLPAKDPKPAAAPVVEKEAKPNTSLIKPAAGSLEKEAVSVAEPLFAASSSATKLSAQAVELIGAAGAADGRGIVPWLGGVALLLLVSIGGYFAMLRPPKESSAAEKLKEEVAEYEITEEVNSK